MEDNYEKTMELANRLSGCALGDNGASPYFNKTAMQASHTLRIQQQKILGIMHSVDKFLEGSELGYDEIMRSVIMREKVLRIIVRQARKGISNKYRVVVMKGGETDYPVLGINNPIHKMEEEINAEKG